MGILILIIPVALLWLLIIRPPQRKMRDQVAFTARSRFGDGLGTASGVLATLLHVEIRYTFMPVLGWLGLAGLGSGFAFRALREEQGPWVAATPFGLVLLASSLAMLHYYEPASGNRPRWREAYEYVERHRSEGDRIVGLATWAGKYYLADDGVEQLKHGLDSGEDDRRGTWFIVKEPYDRMFAERAVLREVFANRTSYPQDTVRVYYRMAASRELAAAADRD